MTILTNLPITATCGTPAIVTIDKTQFVADFGIVDPYWSNPVNWQEIEFYYVNSANGLQVKKMSFAGNTYSLSLKTNIWNGTEECKKITLMDGNGATLAFARASFPVASEFDFASTGGYSPLPPPSFLWDTFYTEIASTGEGELHRTGSSPDWTALATNSTPFGGDFDWHGSFTAVNVATENMMIGYKKSLSGIPDANPANDVSSSLYIDGGVSTTHLYSGATNTAISVSGPSYIAGVHTFQITRIGSVITAKIDGVTIFTDSYVGDLYPIGIIVYNVGSNIISAYNGPVVWSNAWKDALLDLSNSDLTLTGNTAPDFSWGYLNSFQSVSGGGKYYFEMTLNATFPNCYFGASYLNADPVDFSNAGYPLLGGTVDGVYIQLNADGNVYSNGGSIGLNGPSPVGGDVIMMAFDLAAKKLWFGKNGTWSYSGDPATNTGGVSIATQLTTQLRFQIGASLSLTGQVTIASTPLYTPSGFSVV
jgi:hypothetical protein